MVHTVGVTCMLHRWHTHPGLDSSAKRLLHFRGGFQAAPSPSEGRGPASHSAGGGSSEHDIRDSLPWSEPIDAMSCTSSLITVEVGPGAQAYVAVAVAQVGFYAINTFLSDLQLALESCCSEGVPFGLWCTEPCTSQQCPVDPEGSPAPMQAGSTWQLTLKKGHRLVNRTGQALQMLQTCPFDLKACTAGPSTDMITIEPGEVGFLLAYSIDISRQWPSHTRGEKFHWKQM